MAHVHMTREYGLTKHVTTRMMRGALRDLAAEDYKPFPVTQAPSGFQIQYDYNPVVGDIKWSKAVPSVVDHLGALCSHNSLQPVWDLTNRVTLSFTACGTTGDWCTEQIEEVLAIVAAAFKLVPNSLKEADRGYIEGTDTPEQHNMWLLYDYDAMAAKHTVAVPGMTERLVACHLCEETKPVRDFLWESPGCKNQHTTDLEQLLWHFAADDAPCCRACMYWTTRRFKV
jgi:hypothetical protein